MDISEQFHNAHFQPDVRSILFHFVVAITQPIYWINVWVPFFYRLAKARLRGDTRWRAELKIQEQKFEWMSPGLLVPLIANFQFASICLGRSCSRTGISDRGVVAIRLWCCVKIASGCGIQFDIA